MPFARTFYAHYKLTFLIVQGQIRVFSYGKYACFDFFSGTVTVCVAPNAAEQSVTATVTLFLGTRVRIG